jgi:hypothetical protein
VVARYTYFCGPWSLTFVERPSQTIKITKTPVDAGKRMRAILAENAPPMLLAHLVRDAGPRQPHEFGERRIRPTRAARQRRNEAGQRGVAVAIKRPQIDVIDHVASWAAHPREPKPRGNGGADRRRHFHSISTTTSRDPRDTTMHRRCTAMPLAKLKVKASGMESGLGTERRAPPFEIAITVHRTGDCPVPQSIIAGIETGFSSSLVGSFTFGGN